MNLAKSQDTRSIHRNHLHFYILTMKNQEEKLSNESPFTIATQRIKYLGINLPKERKELYTENYMTLMKNIKDNISIWKKYFMFLDRKNQYCENDYTTKYNLQIQCDPCQITNDTFYRTRQKNFTNFTKFHNSYGNTKDPE